MKASALLCCVKLRTIIVFVMVKIIAGKPPLSIGNFQVPKTRIVERSVDLRKPLAGELGEARKVLVVQVLKARLKLASGDDERGSDFVVLLFCHFDFHAVSIAERVRHPLSYPKDF